MERVVSDRPTDLPHHVALHRIATFISTILMLAILAGIVVGTSELVGGAPPATMDDPTTLLFATG